MGKAKGGKGLVFTAEPGKVGNDIQKSFLDELQSVTLNSQVSITSHKLRSCAKMNYGLGLWAFLAVGKYMGHDIMADFFFFFRGDVKINIVLMSLTSWRISFSFFAATSKSISCS
jgi:hypothetical protein